VVTAFEKIISFFSLPLPEGPAFGEGDAHEVLFFFFITLKPRVE